jgi:hypothetical protein
MSGPNAFVFKCLIVVLCLPFSCLAREYWGGTREGMSKAELVRLFGAHLKPYVANGKVDEWQYTLDALQPLCGGTFRVVFGFDRDRPEKGLSYETLELEGLANPDSTVGGCVLQQYTKKYGRPKKSGGDYVFSRGRIYLNIAIPHVSILYRGHCPWWDTRCNATVL